MADNLQILKQITDNYDEFNNRDSFSLDKYKIRRLVNDLLILFFPKYFDHWDNDEKTFERIRKDLEDEIKKVDVNYLEITAKFINRLPDIQQRLFKDIQAIYDGDPSAKTYSEIVLSFPGFLAVFMYRIAHELYELYVPIIPRVICEYAHRETGIDINPGARIGEYFCIDHGTGIVIGETATVGDHVRMYHGVTLGVRKFNIDENGVLLKGGKRHPDIGDYVTIFANATILGGETMISDHSSISTGSLITESNKER